MILMQPCPVSARIVETGSTISTEDGDEDDLCTCPTNQRRLQETITLADMQQRDESHTIQQH